MSCGVGVVCSGVETVCPRSTSSSGSSVLVVITFVKAESLAVEQDRKAKSSTCSAGGGEVAVVSNSATSNVHKYR